MSEMPLADRNTLIKIVTKRGEQAKRDAVERETILRAEVEQQFHREHNRRSNVWARAMAAAEAAATEANKVIREQCEALGVPPGDMPKVTTNMYSRRYSKSEREDMGRLADKRLKALTAAAKGAIDRAVLVRTEQLLTGGLTSDEARAVVDALPTVTELMPALSLDSLGVETWQPPADAAAMLTAGHNPVERRQRQIRHAIESNPGASDRQIAQLLGITHKTVGKYRPAAAQGGEIPTNSPPELGNVGEFPTDSPDRGDDE